MIFWDNAEAPSIGQIALTFEPILRFLYPLGVIIP